MVVLGNAVVGVVVEGQGGSVVVEDGTVVPPGVVDVLDVLGTGNVVVVGHGPTPPPGSGQSR